MSHPPFVHLEYRALLGDKTPTPAPPATDLSAIRATINTATEAASNALPFPGNDNHYGNPSVRSRLSPAEHPYPAALQDVYSTITWLQAHAGDYRVDPARIVAFGQSAGGNLMASAALQAKDVGLSPPIAALVLRYPMLDDRTQMDSADPRLPYLAWSPSSNAMVWDAYLGRSNKTGAQSTRNALSIDTVTYTAAPGRAENLHGLPPALLRVGGLDLFREETIHFATKLASQDVKVQFNIYPGVPHGFDGHPAFTLSSELRNNAARFIQQF